MRPTRVQSAPIKSDRMFEQLVSAECRTIVHFVLAEFQAEDEDNKCRCNTGGEGEGWGWGAEAVK